MRAGFILIHDLSDQHNGCPDDEFRNTPCIAVGRIENSHPGLGCGWKVYLVHSNAKATDSL